jgi:hypothetical protein
MLLLVVLLFFNAGRMEISSSQMPNITLSIRFRAPNTDSATVLQ